MKSPESRAALIAQAAAIINAEFSRLNLDPLNSEQIDALGDESQAFEMLDDFEARLGCSDSEIGEARSLLVDVFAVTEFEERYFVVKHSDFDRSFEMDTEAGFFQVLDAVRLGRQIRGKPPLSGLFIESDWPEYEPTKAALLARINGDSTHAALIAAAPDLLAAANAAIAYDRAIQARGNEPEKMSSHCTAEGDDLDALYLDWITKARAAIAKAQGGL